MMGEVFYPEREFGAAAYNATAGERVGVAYGVFFHEVNETTDTTTTENMGVRAAGRLFCTPYYDEPSHGRWVLHAGIAGMYTDVMEGTGGTAGVDSLRFRSRPEARLLNDARLIDSGEFLGDSFSTLGLEAAAVLGSLSIQGELAFNSANDDAGLDPDYVGAYVYASYFLTGEHRVYELGKGVFDRVKPHTNFWVVDGCVGPGAWELLARWSYLDINPSTAPLPDSEAGEQNNLTLGVNWYWNPNFRWMFNYVHTWNTFDRYPDQTAESDLLGIRGSLDF
jgi:phosphate-selective porin OprO/OprP